MSTNSLWFWQQNRKEEPVRESVPVSARQYEDTYVDMLEFVHQTEISCSHGHKTRYLKIKQVRDSYGWLMPGRITCPDCGKRFHLINPVLED